MNEHRASNDALEKTKKNPVTTQSEENNAQNLKGWDPSLEPTGKAWYGRCCPAGRFRFGDDWVDWVDHLGDERLFHRGRDRQQR